MRIYDLLTSSERRKLSKLSDNIKYHSDNKTPRKAYKERLNERELKELMDVHRDRYKRSKGRVKRK